MVNGMVNVMNYEEKSILKLDNHTRLIFSRILLTIKYILCNLDNSNFAHSNLVDNEHCHGVRRCTIYG